MLQKFEELFNGKLGTRKTDPLELELKDNGNMVCSRTYPVPKVQKEIKKRGGTFGSTRIPQNPK